MIARVGGASPRLIVIAGANGAGKTEFTSQALGHQWLSGCVYVNPDNIANELPGGWNDPGAVLKAAQEAENLSPHIAPLPLRSATPAGTVFLFGVEAALQQGGRQGKLSTPALPPSSVFVRAQGKPCDIALVEMHEIGFHDFDEPRAM